MRRPKYPESPDRSRFPNACDPGCECTVGLRASGRCRLCGRAVLDPVKKRARRLGIERVLKWVMSDG